MKFIHKNLGSVEITEACAFMQKSNPDSSSIFVEHLGEIIEVSKHMIDFAHPDNFSPSPRWHIGLQEWVLTMEPQTKKQINVRRWNGVVHEAAIFNLYIEKPKEN